MKSKLQQFSVKLLATTLAVIMSIPANAFASSQTDSKTYSEDTSVMGIQETDNKETDTNESEPSLIKSEVSTEETDQYIIEKSAALSKATGQLDYKIVVKTKNPEKESTENQATTFGITENTDLKDIKIKKVQGLNADGNETDIKYTLNTPNVLNTTENLRTLGVTSAKPQYGMVYYLSTKLTDEALTNLASNSPKLALDFTIASPSQAIFQDRYALEVEKANSTEIAIDNEGNVVNPTEKLREKQVALHLYKGEYKEEQKGIFQSSPAQIIWTDYINAKDNKEFTYDINLDQSQDTTESQVKIEYYEAQEKGYVLNESFTKTLDFTNSLKLSIPEGYIAKVELNTRPKANAKKYTFNGTKVNNPTYKEEDTQTKEESKPEDENPLPAEEKLETQKAEEIQATESGSSAIALNKDSLLSKFKNEEKLNPQIEAEVKKITNLLETYNKEEITWEEFVTEVKSTALSKEDFKTTIQTLTEGLAEDKYKVANIDADELANEIYPAEESTIKEATEKENKNTKTVDELVKAKLADPNTTIENFQNYMYELETEYGLTNEDAARIYEENAEAIKALIENHRDENVGSLILVNIPSESSYSLSGAFPVTNSPLYPGQSTPPQTIVEVKHSDYLVKENPNVKPIYTKDGKIIATGSYNPDTKTIKYTITDEADKLKGYEIVTFKEDFKLAPGLVNDREYVISNTMTITSSKGTSRNVEMAPNKIKIDNTSVPYNPVDPTSYNYDPNGLYKVNLTPNYTTVADANGNITAIDWNIVIDGTNTLPNEVKDLSQLGLVVNLTSVIGAGLKDIENITVNGNSINTDELKSNNLNDEHIQFSYNYKPVEDKGRRKYEIKFRTPVTDINETHVLDINYGFPNINNYKGAAHRIGTYATNNNSKTGSVARKFDSRIIRGTYDKSEGGAGAPDRVHWIVSDEVNTNDKGDLPVLGLDIREELLKHPSEGATNNIRATYYQKDIEGKMIKVGEDYLNKFPNAGEYPGKNYPPGTIVVFDFYTKLPDSKTEPSVKSGDEEVKLRALQPNNIKVRAEWSRIGYGGQIDSVPITVKSKEGNFSKNYTIPAILSGSNSAEIDIDVPMWELDKDGNLVRIEYEITQDLPSDKRDGDADVSFDQNSINFEANQRFLIKNTAKKTADKVINKEDPQEEQIKDTLLKPRDITITKTDEDGNPLAGAKFALKTTTTNTSDGKTYYEATTDDKGKLTFENVEALNYGSNTTFQLTEEEAPSGYYNANNDVSVTVEPSGYVSWVNRTTTNSFTPKKVYDFKTYSSDPTKKTGSSDGTYKEITSNTTSFLKFDNSNDNLIYYYVLIERSKTAVSGRDSQIKFNLANAKIKNIDTKSINSTDSLYNKVINGTITSSEFNTLTDSSADTKTVLDSNSHGNEGYVQFGSNKLGGKEMALVRVNASMTDEQLIRQSKFSYKYTDKHTSAASFEHNDITEDYIIAPAMGELIIPNENPDIQITNKKLPDTTIAVTKTDSKTNARLPGARIKITPISDPKYNISNAYQSTMTTSDVGAIHFTGLRPGKYKIEEEEAPLNYDKTGDYYELEIHKDGSITYRKYDSSTSKFCEIQNGTIDISQVPDTDISGLKLDKGIQYELIDDSNFLKEGETIQKEAKPAMVIAKYNENNLGDISTIPEKNYATDDDQKNGLLDVHATEGLSYKAKYRFSKTETGDEFKIKFDDKFNLLFTSQDFPPIKDSKGNVIAYAEKTNQVENSVTYIMTDYLEKNGYDYAVGEIEIRGITLKREHEYFKRITADKTGPKIVNNVEFTNTTTYLPKDGEASSIGTDKHDFNINFGEFDRPKTKGGVQLPSIASAYSYAYEDKNGDKHIKYLAYYNTNKFKNWKDGNVNFNWTNDLMKLENVKVYNIPGNHVSDKEEPYSISYGIKPSDPNEYFIDKDNNKINYSSLEVLDKNFNDSADSGSSDNNPITYDFNPGKGSNIFASPQLTFGIPDTGTDGEGKIFEFDFKVRDNESYYNTYFTLEMGSVHPAGGAAHAHGFIGEKNSGSGYGHGIANPSLQTANLNFTNDKKTTGQFNINKTDGNGKKLQNALFILKDNNGNTIKSLTTDEKGSINSGELDPGTYTLEEVRPPEGHELGDISSWTIIVNNEGEVSIKDSEGKSTNFGSSDVNLAPNVEEKLSPFSPGYKDIVVNGKVLGKYKTYLGRAGDDYPGVWYLDTNITKENVKLTNTVTDGPGFIHYNEKSSTEKNDQEYFALLRTNYGDSVASDSTFTIKTENANLKDVKVFENGNNVKSAMENHTIPQAGMTEIDYGEIDVKKVSDNEYQISFPQERWGNGYWNFLVKASANPIDSNKAMRFTGSWDANNTHATNTIEDFNGLRGQIFHDEILTDVFEVIDGQPTSLNFDTSVKGKSTLTTFLRLKNTDNIRPDTYQVDKNVIIRTVNPLDLNHYTELQTKNNPEYDHTYIRYDREETPNTRKEPNEGIIDAVNPSISDRFKIKKIDQNGNPIPNVGFTLFKNKDDQQPIGKETFTNDQGEIYYWNVPDGTYWLKETTIPNGYKLKEDNNPWTEVKVSSGGGVVVDPEDPDDNTDPTEPENPEPETPGVKKSRILNQDASGSIFSNSGQQLGKLDLSLIPNSSGDIVKDYNLNLKVTGNNIETITTRKYQQDKAIDVLFLVERSGSSAVNTYNQQIGQVLQALQDKDNGTSRIGVLYYDSNGVQNNNDPLKDADSLSEDNLKVSYNSAGGDIRVDSAYEKAKQIMSNSKANHKIVVNVTNGSSLRYNTQASNAKLNNVSNDVFVYSANVNNNLTTATYYNSEIKLASSGNNVILGTSNWFTNVINKINELGKEEKTETTKKTVPGINGQRLNIDLGPKFSTADPISISLPKLEENETFTKTINVKLNTDTIGKYDILSNIGLLNGKTAIYNLPKVEVYEEKQVSSLIKPRDIINTLLPTAYAAEPSGNTVDYNQIQMDNKAPEGISFANAKTYQIENIKVGELEVVKYANNIGLLSKKLGGAEFTFFTDAELNNPLKVDGKALTQTTDEKTGIAKFSNLPEGTYYLTETKQPSGYILIPTVWKVTINNSIVTINGDSADGMYKITQATEKNPTTKLEVINKSSTYPSTGGSGTFIGFALIGTAIMLAGIAYYGIYVNDKNRRRFNR